jgi:hypothetical protein
MSNCSVFADRRGTITRSVVPHRSGGDTLTARSWSERDL